MKGRTSRLHQVKATARMRAATANGAYAHPVVADERDGVTEAVGDAGPGAVRPAPAEFAQPVPGDVDDDGKDEQGDGAGGNDRDTSADTPLPPPNAVDDQRHRGRASE
jgi:hypothetical protein